MIILLILFIIIVYRRKDARHFTKEQFNLHRNAPEDSIDDLIEQSNEASRIIKHNMVQGELKNDVYSNLHYM